MGSGDSHRVLRCARRCLISGSQLWLSFAALICGSHLRLSFAALVCGSHLWVSYVALIWDSHLGLSFVALSHLWLLSDSRLSLPSLEPPLQLPDQWWLLVTRCYAPVVAGRSVFLLLSLRSLQSIRVPLSDRCWWWWDNSRLSWNWSSCEECLPSWRTQQRCAVQADAPHCSSTTATQQICTPDHHSRGCVLLTNVPYVAV